MNAFICATFLIFSFVIGDSVRSKNKLLELSFSIFENSIPGTGSRSPGNNFDDSIRNLVKYVRDPNLCLNNPSSGEGKYAQGKLKGTNEIIIPMVLVFEIIGVLLVGLGIAKFFLLKGIVGAKIALIILGIIFARKFRRLGTLMLLKNHEFHVENGAGQYPTDEPNLSGYGFEYYFVPGFQTPEQKYSSLTGKEENKRRQRMK